MVRQYYNQFRTFFKKDTLKDVTVTMFTKVHFEKLRNYANVVDTLLILFTNS